MTLMSASIPGASTPRSSQPMWRAVSRVMRRTTCSIGRRSFRSRAQTVRKLVVKLASQMAPQWAPASERPNRAQSARIISLTADRFRSTKLATGT